MASRARAQEHPRPEVIVDFTFAEGLLFVSVNNIGDKPALKVHVEFDSKFSGEGGNREISALPLFQSIEFLAPHKEIKVLIDSSAAYFARKEPTRLTARITYQNPERAKYTESILHDLEIYRNIGYITRGDHSG
jgi:hypothetical protein